MTPDEAFVQFVEQVQAMGYYFLLRNGASAQDADDSLQETFLKMYQDWQNMREHPNTTALFFVMLNQAYINSHRRGTYRRRGTAQVLQLDFGDQIPDRLPEDCPLEREEIVAAVRDAIEMLKTRNPENYLVLESRLNGRTHSETAADLEIPSGTAASRYRRALEWIKNALRGDDFSGGKVL